MTALAAMFALAVAVSFGAPAQAEDTGADLLLVLSADISRSVDARKFQLQREGYANALTDPRVLRAIAAGPKGRIALAFIEWASDGEQVIIVDWTTVGGKDEAEGVARMVREAPRRFMGRTSISTGIDAAMALLERSPFQAPRRAIDVSGDGTHNSGRLVTMARDEAVAKGVTINGVVILSEVPLATNPMHTHPPGGLTAYYEKNVIGGPGAFVVEADGFEAFGQSLISKLIKEIAEVAPQPQG